MKADWKQWCLAGAGVITILAGVGVIIFYSLAWYWAVAGFLIVFSCISLLVNKRTNQRLESDFSGRPVLNEEEFGRHYFPPEQAEIAAKLRNVLAKHVGIDISRMNPADRFIEDLLMDDFDSMATVEFLIEIEKEFGIEIPDAVAEKITTFQGVVDYVSEALSQKAK